MSAQRARLTPLLATAPAVARRGAADDAWRTRLALAAILALAAALLLWELPDNGWANAYYSDAVRAATGSWSAFWSASLDFSRTVSIDKTPLSIWMMALSARVFGFTPTALLVPNALCALGSVALVNALARRAFGTSVGLLAALFMAATPVITAVGRFNNPDSLLVALLLAAAYAATRTVESGRMRHALACGALVGLAFNTKMLQAYLVLPGFAAALLAAAPGDRRRRLALLAAAGAAMVAVSVAWIGPLSLLPAGARPWVGDTTTNSWWQLVLGANGAGRIAGGGLDPGAAVAGADPLRLLQAPTGGQIAWLLPLTLAGAVAGARMLRRGRGASGLRGGLALWIGWLLVHVVVFSLLGLFHAYYTSALAPAVAVLAAFGARELWNARGRSAAHALGGLAALAATVALAVVLLGRAPHFLPWLPAAIVVVAALGAGLAIRQLRGRGSARVAAACALTAVLVAPLSYAWATTQRQLGGIDPLAGPGRYEEPAWASDGSAARARLIRWLIAHQGGAHYLAAVSGSLAGAPLALLAGRPVLIMGGFAGSDPAPSTGRLAQAIRSGQVGTVVLTGPPRTADGASARGLGGARTRAAWVRAHCVPVTLDPMLPAPNARLATRVYRCAR